VPLHLLWRIFQWHWWRLAHLSQACWEFWQQEEGRRRLQEGRRRPCTTAQQQRHRLQHLPPHGPLYLLQSLGATGTVPHRRRDTGSCSRRLAPWHPRRLTAGPHRLCTSVGVSCSTYLGLGGPGCRPQPDGSTEPDLLGHGLRCFISYEHHGWYSPLPPPFFSFFHHCWQWSHYSYHLSWRVRPSYSSLQFCS